MTTRDENRCPDCGGAMIGKPRMCGKKPYTCPLTPARAEASEGGDPWQDVKPRDGHYYDRSPLSGRISAQSRVYVAHDVDRARAAVEAQHRQEIIALRNEIAALRGLHGIALDQVTTRLRDSRAEIERLTQERDALATQNEQMRAELLDIGAALNDPADNVIATTAQCIGRVKAELDALTAQNAALREALKEAKPVHYEVECHDACLDGEPDKCATLALIRKIDALLAATEGGTK